MLWRGERYAHERVKIAYLSADFRNHAVSFLAAGLFERHDRTKFETIAISFTPENSDDMQARLRNAFEKFIDVRNMSDLEVANLIRELEVDIAVDLMGFTGHHRLGILALRPAPIQVNYLGYPATMGADYIDYIIADPHVVTADSEPHYTEKIVRLPDTFMPTDGGRNAAGTPPSRVEAGLPRDGFVFCAFNNPVKITPAVFDVWMSLLRKVDGSVLWLASYDGKSADNLRREAERRGVAAERLIFAPWLPTHEDHLARYRLADLFIDTSPYNAHSTACDALWAGLPVITCLGTTFAGRVAASLLHAIGLQELIANSLPEYEALAIKLATDRPLLDALRTKLAEHRVTHPLFNTDRFRRHIESAFVTMYERHQRGEPPADISVRRDENAFRSN
jgi:predicted O-linked N-acetylglucosamine transferase (SPINDLY family)